MIIFVGMKWRTVKKMHFSSYLLHLQLQLHLLLHLHLGQLLVLLLVLHPALLLLRLALGLHLLLPDQLLPLRPHARRLGVGVALYGLLLTQLLRHLCLRLLRHARAQQKQAHGV